MAQFTDNNLNFIYLDIIKEVTRSYWMSCWTIWDCCMEQEEELSSQRRSTGNIISRGRCYFICMRSQAARLWPQGAQSLLVSFSTNVLHWAAYRCSIKHTSCRLCWSCPTPQHYIKFRSFNLTIYTEIHRWPRLKIQITIGAMEIIFHQSSVASTTFYMSFFQESLSLFGISF